MLEVKDRLMERNPNLDVKGDGLYFVAYLFWSYLPFSIIEDKTKICIIIEPWLVTNCLHLNMPLEDKLKCHMFRDISEFNFEELLHNLEDIYEKYIKGYEAEIKQRLEELKQR